jgi:hypothetical protein
VPSALHWWWAIRIIGGFIGYNELRMTFSADPETAAGATWLSVVTSGGGVVEALLAMTVVRMIHHRQESKAATLAVD